MVKSDVNIMIVFGCFEIIGLQFIFIQLNMHLPKIAHAKTLLEIGDFFLFQIPIDEINVLICLHIND